MSGLIVSGLRSAAFAEQRTEQDNQRRQDQHAWHEPVAFLITQMNETWAIRDLFGIFCSLPSDEPAAWGRTDGRGRRAVS